MDKIRLGIIGMGMIAKEAHIPNLNLVEEAEIVALCSRSRGNLDLALKKAKDKPRIFTDYNDLLEMKQVDAVIISTPDHTHKEIALKALAKGKHVFCEKPMAVTVEDSDEIIRVAEKTGLIFQVGLELRYSDLYQTSKKLISRGDIGQIQMMWAKVFRGPFLPKGENWILKQELTGGTLTTLGCHIFDLFNWLVESEPVRVVSFGGVNVYKKNETVDNAWVVVEYKNGIRASLGLCLFSPYGNDLEVGVIGDKGKLESYYQTKKIILHEAVQPNRVEYTIVSPPSYKEYMISGCRKQFEGFVSCIKEHKMPLADARAGKLSMLVGLAAEKSIKLRRIVTIGE